MTAGIDTERIRQKLAFILQQAADLRRLADITDKEMFIRDPWLVRGAKYALQTAIEAMIDTATLPPGPLPTPRPMPGMPSPISSKGACFLPKRHPRFRRWSASATVSCTGTTMWMRRASMKKINETQEPSQGTP